jgi:glucose/arabinose dehydrogenase
LTLVAAWAGLTCGKTNAKPDAGNLGAGAQMNDGAGGPPGTAGASGSAGAPVEAGSTDAATATPEAAPPLRDTCSSVPASARVAAWTADPHFCLIRFAEAVPRARQLAFAPNGDLFVGSEGQVLVLFDGDGNGVSDASERSTFAQVPAGNHGVAVTPTHVYASSATTVYRWTYASGDRVAQGPAQVIVQGIEGGGHTSRTLLIDRVSRLYVSVGSASNVDAPAAPNMPPATRAQIRRFNLTAIPAGGYAFSTGEIFAQGLRNEVGLTIDRQGRLWGVENGRDELSVAGDGTMYNDNPAEEVNLFDVERPGRNYGYPFCWSEGIWSAPAARGPGSQHLDPDQPGAFSEAMCQTPAVVVPPAFALRAHLAPLDIVEYAGTAYPPEFVGDLFVTAHGSWNRATAVGRTIIRLHMGANGPTRADNFVGELGPGGALQEGVWAVRPVSIGIDSAGLLTFSDDSSVTVHKIGYQP